MDARIILSLALGGFMGAISRSFLAQIIVNHTDTIIPLGTLTVNLLGSLGLAFVLTWSHKRIALPNYMKIGFATGFFGSFTTFSTISLETINLLEQWGINWWFFYEALNIAGGISMAALGFYLAHYLQSKITPRSDGQC
ncbi:CrcB protein [Desulfitispora alkaliphila]|uniref:fluoride efflux transporter CrcB n=1 Tax=Desulfitispora alkaliphila TaxID=622674 RepID=UPI003D20E3B2